MARQSDNDHLISTIADAQHGVVSRRQLLEAGVNGDTIDMRLRQRRLVGVHRGVYAVGHAELRDEGQWLAAVEAHGRGAALSHFSAAALWQLDEPARLPIHVTVVGGAGRRLRHGLRVHRVTSLPRAEVAVCRAIPVTTVARTIADLAGMVGDRQLEQMIRSAVRLRRFDRNELAAMLDRHPHRPGAVTLRRVLTSIQDRGTAETRSRLEVAFLELCDDYDIPRPLANTFLLGELVDFRWPGTSLVVETDGFAFHAMPTTFAADRRRDQKLTLAGYTVVRFTWDQVTRDRKATATTILRLLSRSLSP